MKKLFVKKADMTEEEIQKAEERKEAVKQAAVKGFKIVGGALAFVGGAVLVLMAIGAADVTVSSPEVEDNSEGSIEAEVTSEEVVEEPAE